MRLGDTFVGRRVELDELRSTALAAAAGRGSLVLLAGEPGIGKTRLCEAVADATTAAGIETRWASCWEGPAAAFWPWTQLVRDQLTSRNTQDVPRDVARLAGEITDQPGVEGDAEPVRFALFDAVARFFRSEAARTPLLLVIDDLHWADVPSLRLLEFVAQDVRAARIAVLATFRDVEVDPGTESGASLERLRTKNRTLHLRGLAATEVAELLASSGGALAATDFARAVHERSGGNPLFVRELAQLLSAQGRPMGGGSLRVPEGVHSVIQRRLARLSQPCHELLRSAAILGAQFDIVELSAFTGLTNDEVLVLLGEAAAARLIAIDERAVGRFVFSHALVRDVLYDDTPLARRAEMHQRAGETLETLGNIDACADELSHHFLQAAPRGTVAKAIEYSVLAGRRALDQLAYEAAAGHYRRAIDALDLAPDDDKRTELLLDLGDAQLRSGDMPAAREAFEAAADIARRRGSADGLARAALGFGAGLGGFEVQLYDTRQIELLGEALDALGSDDSPLRAWVAARLSVALSYQQSIEERRALADEGIAIARRVGERRALAYALAARCDAIAGPDRSEDRYEHATEIIEIAHEQADRPLELLGRRLRIVASLETGDIRGADADIDAFARTAELIRQPLYLWYVSLWRGMRALLDGRCDVAISLADEAAAIGSRAHSANAHMLSAVLRSIAGLNLRRFEDAHRDIDVVKELLPEPIHPYMFVSDAWILGRAGRTREAREALSQLDPGIDWIRFDSEWLATLAQLSEAIDAIGARDVAAEVYDKLLPYRSRFGVDGIGAALHGSMELHLGLLARTMGKLDVAAEHFQAAVEANARLRGRLLVARAQRELAGVVRERDPERAAQLGSESAATYRSLGLDDVEETGGAPSAAPLLGENVFVREGEFWTLSFGGTIARVKDAKGLHDLAKLIAQPGRELAALDLASESAGPSARRSDDQLHTPGHAGELLDDQARAAYKARLSELEEEIEEADDLGDAVRAERARGERDALAHELASAYGLGGRARRAGDPAERARTTVTRRIRDAMSRVEEAHPALGRHLRKSVRTGTFCSYDPEDAVEWSVRLTV